MLFNSLQFLFFFICVTSLFFVLPQRGRWAWLLAASCYFYMAFVPIYIFILGFTICVDFVAGILIEKSIGSTRRKFLICSLLANIGVLSIFKYYNFLNNVFAHLLTGLGLADPLPYLSVLLPIGLSFHTFQAMSYTLEVYRGKQKAERHFGIFALYVMFYPQLVAGPIERPQNLLPQFREHLVFDYDRVVDGLKLMAWGLFKKVVIADRLAGVVDHVYDNPELGNGPSFMIATLFFGFQIFCDFSGYSDMAIGAARVMGFRLMRNFDRPYQACSISEFWHRWHISLSTWFRDYLYIPLGGNRVSIPRWYLNLFIVFLLSGLWHGANWTFVVWGALHGFYFIFGAITRQARQRLRARLGLGELSRVRTLITFALVSVAWVFFRAANLHTALYILRRMVADLPLFLQWAARPQSISLDLGIRNGGLSLCVAVILLLELVHALQNRVNLSAWVRQRPILQRWAVYYTGLAAIIILGVFEHRQFIYFQF
jgi:alginate O-acetyltransferase complex protein AlgI